MAVDTSIDAINELKSLLEKYAQFNNVNPTWLSTKWKVQLDNSGKISLVSESYIIELENGSFSCKDKKANNKLIEIPTVALPLKELQKEIDTLNKIQRNKLN